MNDLTYVNNYLRLPPENIPFRFVFLSDNRIEPLDEECFCRIFRTLTGYDISSSFEAIRISHIES